MQGILGAEKGTAARPREGRAHSGAGEELRAWKTKVRGQGGFRELGRGLGCQDKAKLVQAELIQNSVPKAALDCSPHTPSTAVLSSGGPGTFGQS